jgi:hypothetical protein
LRRFSHAFYSAVQICAVGNNTKLHGRKKVFLQEKAVHFRLESFI